MSKKSNSLIPADVSKKLERLSVINAAQRVVDGEMDLDDEIESEYSELQGEMVELFQPIVDQLAKAGLLSPFIVIADADHIEMNSTEHNERMDGITGNATHATVNGNIQINCECSGGTFKPKGNKKRKK
jgi:hypothetical protein